MLEVKKCKHCGADVAIDYINPCISFRIIDGLLIRDDLGMRDPIFENPYVVFYCSQDREHEIGEILVSYMDEVEEEILNYLSTESDF